MKQMIQQWMVVTWALCTWLCLSTSVQALTQDQVASLAKGNFSAKIKTVEALSATGDDALVPVLNALMQGQLFTRKSDERVVIGQKQGEVYVLLDPISGEELEQVRKSALKKVRVNNRLRGAIRGALGGLTLMSKNPEKRQLAAKSLFDNPNPELAPLLQKALEREEDARAKALMEQALAVITLFNDGDVETRLRAVATLQTYGGPDVGAVLAEAAIKERDEMVKAAVEVAREDVASRLALWHGLGNIFQGISLGSVLLLAAVGLAITFGVMGVINMAHGELVMLGAYTTFVVQEVFRTTFPWLFDWSLLVAVPMAFLVSGAFGVVIERGVIRYLYGRPLETLLATWGISLILQQLVRSIFGPTNREVGNPSWMSGAIETSQGLVLTYNRIAIILFSIVVVAGLALILKKTAFGLKMRAVTQNRRMAASMGIRTGWVDALTFGLGSGIAGMAGVALSQIDNVSPNLGQAYIIDSFMVVVFGGVGNLWGTVVGGFSLGIVNKLLEPMAGAVLGKILVLVAIILFIQKRPRGLFALKGRAVEE